MTKAEITQFLIGKGFTLTPHGHLMWGERGKRVRYKMQATSVRVEHECLIPDDSGKGQSMWTRIHGGYYKNITLNEAGDKLRLKKP